MKERSLHNPLRSETEVFRAVVVVGVAIALLVAVAAIAGSTAAAVLFFCLLAAGGWVLWHRSQGGEPVDAEVASAPDHAHHRVLVVANQTVGGAALLAEIAKRCAGRSAEVHVIAPALTNSQLEHWASDTDEAATSASERLNASVEAIRKLGVRATGDVGDQDPNVALQDGLRAFAADEVIISTHPRERSRWLEHGVVEKARATVPLPVTHVVVDLDAEAAVSAR